MMVVVIQLLLLWLVVCFSSVRDDAADGWEPSLSDTNRAKDVVVVASDPQSTSDVVAVADIVLYRPRHT